LIIRLAGLTRRTEADFDALFTTGAVGLFCLLELADESEKTDPSIFVKEKFRKNCFH